MDSRPDEAKEAMVDLQRLNPNFRVAHVQEFFMMRDHAYVDSFADALRKAGPPE